MWTEPAKLLCPRDSPGKNIGVGCHALLQGIFQTQVLNPCLLPPPVLAGGFSTTETLGKLKNISSRCVGQHCSDCKLEGGNYIVDVSVPSS